MIKTFNNCVIPKADVWAIKVLCLGSFFTDYRDFENVCLDGLFLNLLRIKKKRCAHPIKH